MKPVWIIDDDRSIRWVLEKSLTRAEIEFKSFASADDALKAMSHELPQVVVSDIRMPGSSGLDFLQVLHQRHPLIPVIIMTAYSDLESAVSAFQGGAFEYMPKPFDINHAVDLIRRALEQSRRKSTDAGQLEVGADILGHAPAMQDVFRAIGRLSQSHATVLINGESGTGKELVARALHRHSPRSKKPFIAINTAAIPKDLLESELFGHERDDRGYIKTLLGRRCRFPADNGGRGGYIWTRDAMNKLVQGSAADQTKMAMVIAHEAGIPLQLQVHDELDLTVSSPAEAHQLAAIMRDALPLVLPSRVDVEVGASWGEAE